MRVGRNRVTGEALVQIFTSTSPFSIFNGYTATLAFGLCPDCPVAGSHCHPCHGHTTLPPSINPCPSGPPRCKHRLSIALKVPFTLATQMTLSPQGNSFASPPAGSSDSALIFVKVDMLESLAGPIGYFGCRVWAIITWRLKFSTMFGSRRTSVGRFASDI